MMRTIPIRTDRFDYLAKIAIVAAVYFGAAQLGLLLTVYKGADSLLWPPAGFALAALLLFGDNLWPGVALGIVVVSAVDGAPIIYLIAAGSAGTLEVLVATYLLRRFVGFHTALDRTADALGLIVLGALLGATVSATIGIVGLCLIGQAAWADFGSLWLVWWL